MTEPGLETDTGRLAEVLRRTAGDVRSAGRGIPGYADATAAAADSLEQHAASIVQASVGAKTPRRRARALRMGIWAVALLAYVGVAFVGYRFGVTQQQFPEPYWQNAAPAGTVDSPQAQGSKAKNAACSTLEGAYPALSAPLRAHGSAPTVTVTLPPDQFPNRTLHGEATDLAEILNMNLGPAYVYVKRPWPEWLQAFDNYVAALRAVSFVETNPAAPQTRDGVYALYQRVLQVPLGICHIKG